MSENKITPPYIEERTMRDQGIDNRRAFLRDGSLVLLTGLSVSESVPLHSMMIR